LCVFLVLAMNPVNLIHLDLIILAIFGEKCQL
jgi:hypothetical protein